MSEQHYAFLQVIAEPGESLDEIAQELIGEHGNATYTIVGIIAGDQWPTIRFEGTRYQVAAVKAKWNGNTVGRPRKEQSNA